MHIYSVCKMYYMAIINILYGRGKNPSVYIRNSNRHQICNQNHVTVKNKLIIVITIVIIVIVIQEI